jgi:hypothetical protein
MRDDTNADIESIVKLLSNEDNLPCSGDVQLAEIPSKPKEVPPINLESLHGLQFNRPCGQRQLNQPAARGHVDNPKPMISPIEAVKFDLELIREDWQKYQSIKGRNAVYVYLSAIFRTVIVWRQQKRLERNCELAFRGQAISIDMKMEPFAVLIYCTSDPEKVDAKTRSKWSRALRVAAKEKQNGMKLKDFIKSCGGINSCAALFDRKMM